MKSNYQYYIIIDIEANYRFGTNIHEIIEIGAVKLDHNLNNISTFQSFIKPRLEPVLSKLIRKKTKIMQCQINRARDLVVVLENFTKWIPI